MKHERASLKSGSIEGARDYLISILIYGIKGARGFSFQFKFTFCINEE
jgi:hypothetical protein